MINVDRIKKIILTPKTEWPVIAAEKDVPLDLYKKHVGPLVGIATLATFVGMVFIGVSIPFIGTVRLPFSTGLTQAVLHFVMTLGLVFLVALLVDKLAPTFGAEVNFNQSFKLIAYAMTPGWVAGVLTILPALSILALAAAIYGLYLLYLGLPILKKVPAEKTAGYFAVILITSIVASLIVGVVVGLLSPTVVPAAKPPADVQKWMETSEKLRQTIDKKLEEAK